MAKQGKRVNKMAKAGKKTSTTSPEKFIRKVKKVFQPAKKGYKIFRFSKEFSTSLWQGNWYSGWKFSILMLWWPENFGVIVVWRNGAVDASGALDGFFSSLVSQCTMHDATPWNDLATADCTDDVNIYQSSHMLRTRRSHDITERQASMELG